MPKMPEPLFYKMTHQMHGRFNVVNSVYNYMNELNCE